MYGNHPVCHLLFSIHFLVDKEEASIEEIPLESTDACMEAIQEKSFQTSADLSLYTPRKKNLRKLLQRKRRKICVLNNCIQNSSTIPKKMTKLQKVNKAFQLLEGVISPNLLDFVKKQLTLSLKKKKGRRYDEAFKAWALTL